MIAERTLKKISAGLLGLGVFVRGHGLAAASIWYDEAYSHALTRLGLFELIRVQSTDFTPPLWEMVLYPFAQLSDHAFILRLPAFISGVVSLYLVWLIMDKLDFTGTQRVFTSALVALLPGMVWLAQDARTYSLLAMLILAGFYYALEKKYLGLSAVSGLALYCHPVAPVFILANFLVLLYTQQGYTKNAAYAAAPPVLAGAIWFPFAVSSSGDFWLAEFDADYLVTSSYQAALAGSLEGAARLWFEGLLWFYLFVALAVTLTTLGERAKEDAARAADFFLPNTNKVNTWINRKLVDGAPEVKAEIYRVVQAGILFLVPLTLIIVVSITYANVAFYRPLMLLIMPMSIWLGAAAAPVKINAKTFYKAALPLVFLGLVALALVRYDPSRRGGELERVAEMIAAELGPEDTIFYATGTVALPFEYYLADVPHLVYLDASDQHPGLLRRSIRQRLGYQEAQLADLDPDYIILPLDPLLGEDYLAEFIEYLGSLEDAQRARINYWQASPIEVVKVNK